MNEPKVTIIKKPEPDIKVVTFPFVKGFWVKAPPEITILSQEELDGEYKISWRYATQEEIEKKYKRLLDNTEKNKVDQQFYKKHWWQFWK